MIQKFGSIFNNLTIASVTGASTPTVINLATKAFKKSSDEQELLTNYRKIKALRKHPDIESTLKTLLKQIEELAEERYTINGLENVMFDDRDTIEFLRSGEKLRNTTPLPKTPELINEYIGIELHRDIVKEIRKCSKKGVEAKQVYVLDEWEHITQELKREILDLENSRTSVRIVTRKKLQNKGVRTNETDIVVFGKRKASIGSTGQWTNTCTNATVYTKEVKIDEWIKKYESIFRWGIPIRDISN